MIPDAIITTLCSWFNSVTQTMQQAWQHMQPGYEKSDFALPFLQGLSWWGPTDLIGTLGSILVALAAFALAFKALLKLIDWLRG